MNTINKEQAAADAEETVRALSEHRLKRGKRRNYRKVQVVLPERPHVIVTLPH
jgi:hypothetical protein